MFDVGKNCEVTMIEGDEEGRSLWKIVAFEHPLLKLDNQYEGELIVNVTSPNFVSAKAFQTPRLKARRDRRPHTAAAPFERHAFRRSLRSDGV